MSKPVVCFESRGESGNIFFLMGLVARVLSKEEVDELWKRIEKGNYNDAIVAIKEKVKLIDIDRVY